jgi:hypothetical protein
MERERNMGLTEGVNDRINVRVESKSMTGWGTKKANGILGVSEEKKRQSGVIELMVTKCLIKSSNLGFRIRGET